MTMLARIATVIGLLLTSLSSLAIAANPPKASAVQTASSTARVVPFHGYAKAIELTRGNARAVLCPQVGGRVLQFSVDGQDA
ncbi:MAG: hypothetical protein JWM11_771, partial [Planctomycetaceae bacterium]|nr:hypothetical protein [Planctomycetaceae bacterium]